MFELEMPEGTYFSLSGVIRANTGGQTRALLMRNRLLAQYTSVRPTLLTVDSAPVYPEVRKAWRREGQLVPGMALRNLYEDLRVADFAAEPVEDIAITEFEGLRPVTETHPDGSLYRTRYLDPSDLSVQAIDYHRPDGSRYLRIPVVDAAKGERGHLLLNGNEEVIKAYRTIGELYRFWIRWLAPADQRVFIISDSRFTLAHVVPFSSPRFHVMHLMHNVHTKLPRTWNAGFAPSYGPLLQDIRHLDGLVTLTPWQREDVIARFGETNNLFVVPNPVEIPPRPAEPPERRPHHFVAVARLEWQKRLEDAVRIFARVLKRVPDATFDIYGQGAQEGQIRREIEDLGVGHAVTLRGYDPRAREAMWTATGFIMTSRNEGYPLATLESMSQGCPVISYDIKYGPRDQISDGVDGFLVKPGDLDGFADRVVELAEHPETAARMSEAAYKKAERHDYKAFLTDWHRVITTVAKQKQDRVDITKVRLSEERVDYLPTAAAAVPGLGRRTVSAASGRPRKLKVSGRLDISIANDKARLKGSRLELYAVCDATAGLAPIPVTFTRSGTVVRFQATVDPEEIFRTLGDDAGTVRLRLTYICANFSWRANLGRGQHRPDTYEIAFDAADRLLLSHTPR